MVETIDNTKIEIENNYFFNTSNITYDLMTKKISSNQKSFIEDSDSNKIEIKDFTLSFRENILRANNANIIDKNLNQYEIEKLFYDLKQKRILGKDVKINEDNKLSKDEYLPRAKGRSLILEKDNMTLKKYIY